MKIKQLIFMVLSILLLITSLFFAPFPKEKSDFYANNPNVTESSSHEFNLKEDNTLYFKASSFNLDESSSITFTNLDSGKVIFDWQGNQINDLLIEDISKGRYKLDITFTNCYMNYRIKCNDKL
jgi:hypothetical protein